MKILAFGFESLKLVKLRVKICELGAGEASSQRFKNRECVIN